MCVCVWVWVGVSEARKNVITSHNNLVVALCRAHFNLMTIIFIKMISVTMIIFHTYIHGNNICTTVLLIVLFLGWVGAGFWAWNQLSPFTSSKYAVCISSPMHKSSTNSFAHFEPETKKKKNIVLLLFYVGFCFSFRFSFAEAPTVFFCWCWCNATTIDMMLCVSVSHSLPLAPVSLWVDVCFYFERCFRICGV